MNEITVPATLFTDNTILAGVRGSIAHGMYVPSTDPDSIDDKDYMSVFVADSDHYLGIKHERETREVMEGEVDLVEYEIRKYIRLLMKGNPNVLSLLWLKPEQYIKITPSGQKLINARDYFFSKTMIRSFVGYAYGQLQKMGKFNTRGFRGEKRKELIERYGYDTKNAAHCVRLLRMCIEYCKIGQFNVDRTGIDAEELLSIKRGAWSQDKVIANAVELKRELEHLATLSTLPESPDENFANSLCIDIVMTENDIGD